MVSNLPNTKHSEQSTSLRWLLILRNVASVTGLIHEEHDQDKLETPKPKLHPKYVPPVAGAAADDEITKQWPKMRRSEEERRPDADHSGILVVEEH